MVLEGTHLVVLRLSRRYPSRGNSTVRSVLYSRALLGIECILMLADSMMPHTKSWYRRWWLLLLFTRPLESPYHSPPLSTLLVPFLMRQLSQLIKRQQSSSGVNSSSRGHGSKRDPSSADENVLDPCQKDCSFDGAEHMVAVLNDPPPPPMERCTKQKAPKSP